MCSSLGEVEYISYQRNISYGAHEIRDGTSYTEQEKKKYLVTTEDLSTLKDLEAFVKFSNIKTKIAKISLNRVGGINTHICFR